MAYRWEHTDAALTAQLELADEGYPSHCRARACRHPVHQPDHRRRRPADHAHRVPPAARRRRRPTPHGRRLVCLAGVRRRRHGHPRRQASRVEHGRPVRGAVLVRAVASTPTTQLDLFRFSDEPVYDALGPRPRWPARSDRPDEAGHYPVDGGTPAVDSTATTRSRLGDADLVELLRRPDWRDVGPTADGPPHPLDTSTTRHCARAGEDRLRRAQLPQPHPGDGPRAPEHPTLFAKYRPRADRRVRRHHASRRLARQVDWEAELAVVIGAPVRHADPEQARAAIAGYTVLNDVTARDWQYRTAAVAAGQDVRGTTPIGPWLVTADEARPNRAALITCEVDGELCRRPTPATWSSTPPTWSRTSRTIVTLVPGDVIATGTPGGVGHARKPPRYLADGSCSSPASPASASAATSAAGSPRMTGRTIDWVHGGPSSSNGPWRIERRGPRPQPRRCRAGGAATSSPTWPATPTRWSTCSPGPGPGWRHHVRLARTTRRRHRGRRRPACGRKCVSRWLAANARFSSALAAMPQVAWDAPVYRAGSYHLRRRGALDAGPGGVGARGRPRRWRRLRRLPSPF